MKFKLNSKMQVIQTAQWIRTSWLAALSAMVIGTTLPVQAFTSADADTLFEAHATAFYQMTNGGAFYLKSTEGNRPDDFWKEAEQMEMVLDTYERTTNTQQLAMFTNLVHGFQAEHGRTWERNPFNDDIMWAVIACTRGYLLSGNHEFLAVARTNFDLCYARAASTNLGGGLWWKVGERTKNACVNGPGSIAAFLLGKATGNDHYFTISTNLFIWERNTLFNATTGKIYDSIRDNGRIANFALTYNQGTFVGAANFLGYSNEARQAALYTMNRMCRDGYLPSGGESGDGGGFAGIGVRWIARYMKDRGEQSTFLPWLQRNAEAAWQSRRASDNLSNGHWPQPTPPGKRYSWGCSPAVVIMQVTPPTETVKSNEK
jgi:predicted alpha-1,6-mannanase (GH76 family)